MKPPYRVPSMAEIAEIPWNGYNVISTFSGGGGSSLGYRLAGYRVLWANEFVPAAQDTYNANKAPYTILDGRDIRTVTGKDILEAIGLQEGELDILDGSPPCASFSTAGKREEGWGKVKKYSDTAQRVDDLFFEYSRLIGEMKPKTFIAENVSGLVKGSAKGYFKWILGALKANGYRVEARLLDAQWLGVPQARQRVIFIGVREDLGLDPVHPDPLPYRYSVRDAIPWIVAIRDRIDKYKDSSLWPSNTILAGGERSGERGFVGNATYIESETDISRYAIGAEWERMGRPGSQSEKYFQLVRPSLDEPSSTITQRGGDNTVASVTHQTEKRKFSIAELKRVCSFPDDFSLTGTYAQQWERLGRAVPPVMMQHIAATVRDKILNRICAE